MTPILTGVVASGISGHLTPPYDPSSFVALSSITVGSGGTSSIEFTGIPANYKSIQIRAIGNSVNSGTANCYIRFNSDTSSNYSLHRLYSYGGGNAVNNYSNTAGETNYIYGGANSIWSIVMDIPEYANTKINKTASTFGGYEANGAGEIGIISSNWRSTDAIHKIAFTNNGGGFTQYTQFALYGVK